MFGQISLLDGGNPLKIDKPIRLIELFAGIGAQAKAIENLGIPFEHYRICEFDKYAVRSYNAVHGTAFETSDITKITAADVCVCDTDKYTYIMTYSFPCTDLSSAGKQAGMSRDSGTRSGLLWEVERLLKEMDELPQILLMENVPEVVSDKNMKDFAEWIAFLDSLGYRSKYEILNAKNYGVPQNRERCFMVSWLGDYYFDFPEPVPLEIRLKDVLEPVVDEKYYLSDEAVAKLKLSPDFVARERGRVGQSEQIVVAGSLNPDKEVQDRVRVLSPEGICQGLRATDYKDPPKILWADGVYTQQSESFRRGPLHGVSRAIKAEQHDAGVVLYGDDIVPICNLYDSGIKGYNRMNGLVCSTDGISPTTRANSGGHNEIKIAILLPFRIRKLIPKECWRLMGFDDGSFERAEKVNSNSQLYKQAGNSIVVDVLMAIFREML